MLTVGPMALQGLRHGLADGRASDQGILSEEVCRPGCKLQTVLRVLAEFFYCSHNGILKSRALISGTEIQLGGRSWARTAVYGPVRTVVWEGRSREAPPIPITRGKSGHRLLDTRDHKLEPPGERISVVSYSWNNQRCTAGGNHLDHAEVIAGDEVTHGRLNSGCDLEAFIDEGAD